MGIALIALGAAGHHAISQWLEQNYAPVGTGTTGIVEVPPGTGTGGIASILKDEQRIPDETAFKVGVWWWKLSGKLKAGHYRISPEMTPKEIAELIASGKEATVKLTIPEGFTAVQIAERVAAAGLCSVEEFLAAAVPATVAELELGSDEYDSLEGYLFPATYVITFGATPDDVVLQMTDAFMKRIAAPMAEGFEAGGRTRHEMITIASLIEREARVEKDRALISAVIHNRVKKGMRLDIDATVLYALGEHKDVITREDLRIDSPFNTRRYKGIPPHPIASPGEASVRAALNPASVDYLFYVAKPDGSHVFTRTNAEHERAKRAIREGRI